MVMQRAFDMLVLTARRENKTKTYPSVIILVQDSYELARLQLKLVVHGRLEFELDTVYVIRAACTSSSDKWDG